MEKKAFQYAVLGLLVGIAAVSVVLSFPAQKQQATRQEKQEFFLTPTVAINQETFSYAGKNGADALTLLKEKAAVEQDASGLVISINNRKADSGNREYWAFYVNGALAPVGPADYKTKDTDKIEWKIETY
ncbi:MAG: DUF4430 domain-containing protein [Candidatus Levybacteria bacterium]|nr:DUF4430 domain-containing protein [Candidatus Levybacteria bacterium]